MDTYCGWRIVHQEEIVRANVIHRNQIFDGLHESLECLVMREVADMLADEGLPIDDQRDGVFQVRAQGQHRALDRQRVTAPGA